MDPSEGQVTASDGDKDGGGLERKGGAQITLLGQMQTDPKTGTLPDRSLEHKPCESLQWAPWFRSNS